MPVIALKPPAAESPLAFLNSLRGRFIAASVLCLPLFIGASGWLLERAFKDSLLTNEQEQLQSQLYILLGAAELQNNKIWLPQQLPDPRYGTIDSGLYGQILTPSFFASADNTNQSVSGAAVIPSSPQWHVSWESDSSKFLSKPLPQAKHAFAVNSQSLDVAGDYFRFSKDLQWLDDGSKALPLRFEIFHSRDNYLSQLRHYRKQLWYSLSFLAMGLIVIQVLIMSWGLSPVRRLARQIRRMRNKPQQRLQGDYPEEIRPLTSSLNALLDSEQQQRERYKNTLGDLAHSLKTPLAILQGELQQNHHNPDLMQEQVERMGTIIRHQLQRAVVQSDQQRHQQVEVAPIIERLCNAMGKVYHDKHIRFDVQILPETRYPIESQDLFELLGNLIENACKYGNDQVTICAYPLAQSLLITVADNGAGVDYGERHNILQRGARADTAKPGQGIGLSVTTDIVSAYKGSVDVTRSKALGGAEFQVRLPITS